MMSPVLHLPTKEQKRYCRLNGKDYVLDQACVNDAMRNPVRYMSQVAAPQNCINIACKALL